MAKKKKKEKKPLSPAQKKAKKAARARRRKKYMWIFMNGKQVKIERPIETDDLDMGIPAKYLDPSDLYGPWYDSEEDI